MNVKKVEPFIPVERFLDDLGFCDEHSDKKKEILKTADALRILDGKEYFSLPEYTRYVLGQLELSRKELISERSAYAFTNATFMAKEYLSEWISILTCLLDTAVEIDAKRKIGFDAAFKMAIVDFQHIFYRLRSIFEFAYDLAYTGQISQKDENADSIE